MASIKWSLILIISVAFIAWLLGNPDLPPHFNFEEYSLEPAIPTSQLKDVMVSDASAEDRLFEDKIKGPEGLAVYENTLYTGLMDGRIIAVKDENDYKTVVNLRQPCIADWDVPNCGRPLGLSFDKKGNLFVADAYFGIYKVNISTGEYSLVISSDKLVENEQPLLPNSVVVGSDEIAYWSDSSARIHLHDIVISFLGDQSGRLIQTDLKTGESKVLINNLRFANGVFLAEDESYVLVAETLAYRVHRYWLKGPSKGKSEILIDQLPGLPDNLSPTADGGFIVNLIQSRNSTILTSLSSYPLVRKFAARLLCLIKTGVKKIDENYPSDFWKQLLFKIAHYETVPDFFTEGNSISIFYDKTGKAQKTLFFKGNIPRISDIADLNGRLYLGSPTNKLLGRVTI